MAEAGARRARVVVADDEPANRELLRRILGTEFEVREAADGPTALALLEQAPAAVLLADHAMPRMSGADLVRQVSSRWPFTVCLLLTGYDDDPAVLAARAAGHAFAVVSKPWSLQTVLRAVRDAAAESGRRSSQ